MRIKRTHLLILALVGLSVILFFDAFNSYIDPYLTATQLRKNSPVYLNKNIQSIGRIVNGSISWKEDGTLLFDLSDEESTIRVAYKGNMPQNFKEGEQAVVVGKLISINTIEASEILLKCPSKYEGEQDSLLTEPVFIMAILLGTVAIAYFILSSLLKKRI
jgi:cytochrome c-type biogenesis protein CcmE